MLKMCLVSVQYEAVGCDTLMLLKGIHLHTERCVLHYLGQNPDAHF